MTTQTQHILVAALAIATAAIHFVLVAMGGFDVLQDPLALPFILNTIGFAGLLGLFLITTKRLTHFHEVTRWLLIGFSLLTIVAFFVVNPAPFASVLGLLTKVIEAGLIGVLWAGRPK